MSVLLEDLVFPVEEEITHFVKKRVGPKTAGIAAFKRKEKTFKKLTSGLCHRFVKKRTGLKTAG